MRTVKTISLPKADKVGVPQAANGKPPAPNIPTPRDSGGMATGNSSGNYDGKDGVPREPTSAWDMESQK